MEAWELKRTSNIQRRTLNVEVKTDLQIPTSTFDVRRSTLDVRI
jgi:hypothetical protein